MDGWPHGFTNSRFTNFSLGRAPPPHEGVFYHSTDLLVHHFTRCALTGVPLPIRIL